MSYLRTLIVICITLSINLCLSAQTRESFEADTNYQNLLDKKQYAALLESVSAKIISTPEDASLYYFAAQAHMGLKNYQDSVENAAQAVLKDPKQSDYFRLLADTAVLKQLGAENTSILRLPGVARRAKRNYQTAIYLDPDNIKAREGLGLFYLLAPRIVGGSVSKAKIQADAIAEQDMNKAMPFYIGIQKKYKKWDKALQLVDAWQAREPELWRPYEDRFRIYFEQKKYESAAQILLRYLEKDSNEMNANYLLGLVSSDSGLYLEQGRDALLKYLQSTPDLNQPGHEWSYYRLATIYKKLGETELARQAAAKALTQSPQNTKVAALVNDFLKKLNS